MLIVGAGGFAKEVLEVCFELQMLENLVFYDDVNDPVIELFGFPVLKDLKAARDYLSNIDNRFTIGIGNPMLRKSIHDKFVDIGGRFTSVISSSATIGKFDVSIGDGCNILSTAFISNSVKIGKGTLIYYNAVIAHDVIVNDFVELSPGATLLGGCKVGAYTQIGANATILPKVNIGKKVVVGAGAVVTKDILDGCTVVGIPGRIINQDKI